MKKQFNIKTGMKLISMVLLVVSLGCNQQGKDDQTKDHVDDPPVVVRESARSKCEVEKKGPKLQKELLVSAEKMKSTINKLHEVLEDHNHADIKEHAGEVEEYTLDLMEQSVYLPMSNFSAIHEKTKVTLKLSTQYAWENKYHSFAENSETFEKLESSISDLEDNIKGMDDIPSEICETERNIARKNIYVHLYIMNIYIEQVDKATDRTCLGCVKEYCEKLEDFVNTFRETITNISTGGFTTLNRTLADIEHSVHEMKEKAEAREKEDLHHAHEIILRQMERLQEEVEEVS